MQIVWGGQDEPTPRLQRSATFVDELVGVVKMLDNFNGVNQIKLIVATGEILVQIPSLKRHILCFERLLNKINGEKRT